MTTHLRLAPETHRAHDWRIDAIAPDFDLLDVWRMPMSGGPGRLPDVLACVEAMAPDESGTGASGALFRLRGWLGQVFGWDREVNSLPIPGCEETSLRDRLAEDERAPLPPPSGSPFEFVPVYRDEREAISELSNGTVHAVMHLSWIREGEEDYEAHMAVYVKHRGRLGRLYMGLISPFRHFIVYPAMMRRLGALWRSRGAKPVSASTG